MAQNYVFLDFDGVLTSIEETPGSYLTHGPVEYGASPTCLSLFLEFIQRNDVNIVISSNWRRYPPDGAWYFKKNFYSNQLSELVNKLGSAYAGDLPVLEQGTKLDALRVWMTKYGSTVGKFIIFDDDLYEGFSTSEFQKNFIHTDYRTGLTRQNIINAERILNNG